MRLRFNSRCQKEITAVVLLLAITVFFASYEDFVSAGRAVSAKSEITGWGVPWNVFSAAKEPSIIVTPDPVQVASGKIKIAVETKGEFVRNDFYIFDFSKNTWTKYKFQPGESSDWLQTGAKKEVEIDSSSLSSKNFVVTATCHKDGQNKLWCGCRDVGECNMWQTQTFDVSSISGDFNSDKKVNMDDFILFKAAFEKKKGEQGYDAKFNLADAGDSKDKIDFDDFFAFASVFGFGSKEGKVDASSLGALLQDSTIKCSLYDYAGTGKIDEFSWKILSSVIEVNSRASQYPGKIFDINKDGKIDTADFHDWAVNPNCPSDLDIESIATDPSSPAVNAKMKLTVKVKNKGSRDYTAADATKNTRLSCDFKLGSEIKKNAAFTVSLPISANGGERILEMDNIQLDSQGAYTILCTLSYTLNSKDMIKEKSVVLNLAVGGIACTGTAPTGTGVIKGSSTYTAGYTQTSWAYADDATSSTPCKWKCDSSYKREGNSCVPTSTDTGTGGAVAVGIPAIATFDLCREASYNAKFDFNSDGKVTLADAGDLNGDGTVAGSERGANIPPSSYKFAGPDVSGYALKCPSGVFCDGRYVTLKEQTDFLAFAKKCDDLGKTAANVCQDKASYDLNTDNEVDVRDVAVLLDIVKQTSPTCPTGKVCDLNQDKIIDLNDVKLLASASNRCSGVSLIDYNSDGILNSIDLDILKNIYAPTSSSNDDQRNYLTLKMVCYDTRYDFLGVGTATSVAPPDGKLTQVDIGPNGGASGKKNGANTAGVSDLKETFRWQCPAGTFCAGRVPTQADVDLMSSYLTKCNALYAKYPTITGASSFTQAFISQNKLDVNNDGKVDDSDVAMVSNQCPSGKVCNLDGTGVTNSADLDMWLKLVSIKSTFG